jgi:hypothetical protein
MVSMLLEIKLKVKNDTKVLNTICAQNNKVTKGCSQRIKFPEEKIPVLQTLSFIWFGDDGDTLLLCYKVKYFYYILWILVVWRSTARQTASLSAELNLIKDCETKYER